jgi:hypothetical protein
VTKADNIINCKRPDPIQSSAYLHGINLLHIETILDIILLEENKKETYEPMNWEVITLKVNETIGKRVAKYHPTTLQRIWKYLAYGQLFACSSSEINEARERQLGIADMLHTSRKGHLVPCDALPSSDEEDFRYTPEDFAIGSVDHTIAVLARKKRKVEQDISPPFEEVAAVVVLQDQPTCGKEHSATATVASTDQSPKFEFTITDGTTPAEVFTVAIQFVISMCQMFLIILQHFPLPPHVPHLSYSSSLFQCMKELPTTITTTSEVPSSNNLLE